jgi:hypothetical protein
MNLDWLRQKKAVAASGLAHDPNPPSSAIISHHPRP